MLNILGIDHLVLRTDKREAMIAFYTGVLGCYLERETTPEIGLTQLRAGNALIDIVDIHSQLGQQGGGAPTGTENNLDHLCLLISPLDEDKILAHLDKHGVVHGEFTARYGSEGFGNSLYLTDPQGNTVELRCAKTG